MQKSGISAAVFIAFFGIATVPPFPRSLDGLNPMPTPRLPEEGILWRGWSDETLKAIDEKGRPVLLFVADPDPLMWPFLREIFREMPANARLRALLHEYYLALYIEANALPNVQKELGAGSRYHIAILSPHGLTPMITFGAVNGKPASVVDEIVAVLERLLDVRRC